MKLLIVSDLHTEWHQDKGKCILGSLDKNADIIVVAGDLTSYQLLEDNLRYLCDSYKQVVYVAGNHEEYGTSFLVVYNLLDKLSTKLNNLHWLENREVEIEGKRFIGATLWFDKHPNALPLKSFLNDFGQIKDFEKLVFAKHDFSRSYLRTCVKKNDIVVTHHLPSFKCVNAQYKDSPYNIYFATNLDEVIEKNKPKYWCCGHTHIGVDMMINKTRVIANPLGYPHIDPNNGENPYFSTSKTVEV